MSSLNISSRENQELFPGKPTRSLGENNSTIERSHRYGTIFKWVAVGAASIAVAVLAVLLFDIFTDGAGRVNWEFFQNYPSRHPEGAGIKSALYGSIWVIVFTVIISLPLGIGAAFYLEEFAPKNRLTEIININIANLAAVPSIVYGILGLALFVRAFSLGRSVLAGAFTMGLLILPIIIIASREAIRGVPSSVREASMGLGATKWQTVRHHVFPQAFPGILTGTILALSRAVGETAPLIMIGALTFVPFVPGNIESLSDVLSDPLALITFAPFDGFTVLPIQIFNWVSRPEAAFHVAAAAAIVVLLAILLSMNALAIFLRYRFEKKGPQNR
ncbi:MAG: phosphate ABC transporter permease PstA [Candidatus Marinimicrobia bacterium]|nr:phosphate ABC transporter permease PstA [Candidatus Neomarinimicrobiota bacterium]MCF7828151.1 phosphate ABC transporter permease PstA [Candidatus Neomarinimicrobiota bacterium]MCF7879674.1 phosphate ABC transporter permease PstA [Candidatus Neomarinimicrobiota bacterium]